MRALDHMIVLQGSGRVVGRSHFCGWLYEGVSSRAHWAGFRGGSRMTIHLPQISTKIDYR